MTPLDLARQEHETWLLAYTDAQEKVLQEITEAAKGGIDLQPQACKAWQEFLSTQSALMASVSTLIAALRTNRAPRIIVN